MKKGLYLGDRKSVTVFCHKGNLRIDYRNARDVLAGMNRGIGYQTIHNHACVVGHILQVLVDGHGLLATLDKRL